MATKPITINNRYILNRPLGQGGMGTVYHATDRLTGEDVALKRVNIPTTPAAISTQLSTANRADFRLALAQEFKTLASLRHPNIISVLDYGFDTYRQPYFTMTLLEGAQTIIDAGNDHPQKEQLQLLVQALQALAYLHHRGIIHRDMKPDNVLVINEQVKLLDFGLALARKYKTAAPDQSSSPAGTIAYMAPEILKGRSASESSDLYAVGIITYELLAGRHPFDIRNMSLLINDILNTIPDVWSLETEEQLLETLERLLAKKPEERLNDINQIIKTYLKTAQLENGYTETAALRESYIQAAEFVGRDAEFNQLTEALNNALAGQGAGWLVGGESGVGKSRLLDELRTYALVSGALVLRGQAIRESSAPYTLWRGVVRHLTLQTELTNLEASVLKTLVPDIAFLIGRPVSDPTELAPQAAQDRLHTVIEDIFQRQTRPIVLLLEDLQWADEGITILQRLSRNIHTLPLLIIGSYRNDEAPGLPGELPKMHPLQLQRLDAKTIADLSASMLGDEIGRREAVVDLLRRETEGNIFFIVEVVRALAEEAGQLDQIGQMTLPRSVFGKGMKTVIQHRLNQVPDDAYALLQIAAVAGRELDLAVLQAILDAQQTIYIDLDRWLDICVNTAVIQIQEGNYFFAHDKLRQHILEDLDLQLHQRLHQRIATAIETVYPDDLSQAATLTHHWKYAKNKPKEAHYAAIAGQQTLANGAYQEAIPLLERALTLAPEAKTPPSQQAAIHQWLGEAYYGLGRLTECRQHSESAITLLIGQLGLTGKRNLARQAIRQIWHRLPISKPGVNTPPQLARDRITAALASQRLALIYYFDNDQIGSLYYVLLGLNLAELAGPAGSDQQTFFYGTMAVGAGGVPLHAVARLYIRLTDHHLAQIEDLKVKCFAVSSIGAYLVGIADWGNAQTRLTNAMKFARRAGDTRQWQDATSILIDALYYQGRWENVTEMLAELVETVERQNNVQFRIICQIYRAAYALRRGEIRQAIELLDAAEAVFDMVEDNSHRIWALGLFTEAYTRLGDLTTAAQYAERTATNTTDAPPVAYWTLDGYAGMAELYLTCWEADPTPQHRQQATKACKLLRQYSGIFDIGRPLNSAYQCWYHYLDGKPAKARKAGQQAIEYARQYYMPYEEAVAYYQLGRHLPPTDPDRQQYLQQAVTLFEQLGAAGDLQRACQALNPD